MFRFKPRGVRVQYAFPLLFAAFTLPPERRRQHATPLVFKSIKSLASFTSLFIPQIPIPDTSKIKDSILGKLPSWTVQSAASTFIRKPQADIVVGLSLEPRHFRVFVAYYPKGEDILIRTGGGDEIDDEGWVELAKPELMVVDGWPYTASNGDTSFCPATVQYTTSYPHKALHNGHPMRDGLMKRYDPSQTEFLINFEDFMFAEGNLMDNPGNKPPTFKKTSLEVMSDFARLIREHVENFISEKVLEKATLVNDEPVVKWMVMYPDVLDAQIAPGLTCKRDFVLAFKKAGYSLDESDLPTDPGEQEQPEPGYSHLEDLGTESRMVEFLSAGYAGLVGYASLQPINKHIPAIPQEKPFTTVIDDQLYFSARLCLLTPEARFGVVHHPLCSSVPSPVFKQLPEEHINLIIRSLVNDGVIPHEEGVDVDISDDPEMVDFVSSHVITDWPECKAWKDAVEVLAGTFNREEVVLETDPENHPSGIMRALKTSAISFAIMISQGIGVAAMDAFGAVHANEPTMTDVVLFDSNRGEEEAYRAVFNWVNIPKETPREKPAPEQVAKSVQQLGELDVSEWGAIIIESPDYTKLIRDKDIEFLGVTEEDVKNMKEVSESVGKFDRERYRKLRVVRPQTDGIWLEVGLCEAVRLECARIFGDALRK